MLRRVGKYRIGEVIGRGAVGVVYKGYDDAIDRPLAVKTLRPEFLTIVSQNDELRRRFAVEARSAGRCLHPNIVTVFDFVEHDGAPFIVMEYVSAGTLENVLRRGVLPPVRQVGEIVVQLLFALGYAHSKGVIHRDIKPANILCPTASSIKVSDFGVAHIETLEFTQPGFGAPVGTPNYMSPERFLGHPADGRSDLFSAGVILYQLLTGTKPFLATELSDLIQQLMESRPPSIRRYRPELWSELDDVISMALARQPEDRFQTADAFIEALNAAIEAHPPDGLDPLDLTGLSLHAVQEAAPTSRQGLNHTMAETLSSDTIDELSQTLARWLGPIAKLVVKQASRQATDADTMLNLLLGQIGSDVEASAFRVTARRVLETADAVGGLGPRPVEAVHRSAPVQQLIVSPDEIRSATAALLPLIGPVADKVVARQSAQATSLEDFYRRLADFIPSEQDRALFLALRSTHGT